MLTMPKFYLNDDLRVYGQLVTDAFCSYDKKTPPNSFLHFRTIFRDTREPGILKKTGPARDGLRDAQIFFTEAIDMLPTRHV